MPVLVVGADTPMGSAILSALIERGGEVRAFVTDPLAGEALRHGQAKVAVGDVSDESHVEAAAAQAFSAILVTACASDGRELSFADSPRDVLAGWARALRAARVRRAIWVTGPTAELDPDWIASTPEHAVLRAGVASSRDVAEEVARLDEAGVL